MSLPGSAEVEIVKALQGERQMNCEGQEASAPANYAAQDCCKTEPAKNPYPGFNEMAEEQIGRIAAVTLDKVKTELIRAREMGQRERREESAQQMKHLQATIGIQRLSLLTALDMTPRLYMLDARVPELEERNKWQADRMTEMAKSLGEKQEEISTLRAQHGNQAATIAEYQRMEAQLTQELAKARTENSMLHKPIHISRINGSSRTIFSIVCVRDTMSGLFIEVA
jgi:hypothetical protein